MIVAIVLALSIYCLFLVLLITGWVATKERPQLRSPSLFYSVIVPFRNEEDNLPNLLDSLSQLDFPDKNYEVILVNDHSTDNSRNKIEKGFVKSNVRVLDLIDGEGKKAALAQGIKESKGDVVVTTDADCIVQPPWLGVFAQHFETQEACMTFGGVAFANTNRFFESIQQVEFASLIGSGAATLKLGMPSMCNGANLAFLKSVYDRVGGYDDHANLPTGDDEFLMHKMHKLNPKKVFYMKNTQSVVYTEALKSFEDFFQQRKRWASKWKHYTSFKNSLLAVLVMFFHLSVIGSAVAITLGHSPLIIASALFAKAVLEFLFIFLVLRNLRKSLNFLSFIFLQICYPFYVVLFGLTANFGQYTWKGRKHKL